MAEDLDDDYFGAECEMDDQFLLATDDDEDEFEEDRYEQEFQAKEKEYSLGNISDEDLQWTLNEANRYLQKRKPSDDNLYPPERKPPIFDFFTVLTAFIVAVILAYYTISSY